MTRLVRLLCFSLLLYSSLSAPADAQVVVDTSLGSEGSTRQPGDPLLIGGGATRGVNLFHSFEQFSIPENQQVFFFNPPGIEHIFSRVTGGEPSEILGTLGVRGPADLFLLNPNGILFGPNARLNVAGSLVATTGESLTFPNHGFSAVQPEIPPLLTLSEPTGIQFGREPAPIRVEGPGHFLFVNPFTLGIERVNRPLGLAVIPNRTLALIGGPIELEGGNLTAVGGRVELGSVGTDGKVTLAPHSEGWELGYKGVEQFQDIALNNASIELNGADGGSLQIQGNNLWWRQGSVLLGGAATPGGTQLLQIEARGEIELSGVNPKGTTASAMSARVEPGQVGDANPLQIKAGQLTLRDGAAVSSTVSGQGNAAVIRLDIADSIELSGINPVDGGGSLIQSRVAPNRVGNASNLEIKANQLLLQDGAILATSNFGIGRGGDIQLNVGDGVELSGINGFGRGSLVATDIRGSAEEGGSGNIEIGASQLRLRDGAQIAASTLGRGDAGNVNLKATESVELSGVNGLGEGSIIRTDVTPSAVGNGGSVNIETAQLRLQDGAIIGSATFGQGDAGNVAIQATERIELGGINELGQSSFISANVGLFAVGNGGQLTLKTTQLQLQDGAQIVSDTSGLGDSGDIRLTVAETLSLSGTNPSGLGSVIATTVSPTGVGDAGTIWIITESLDLQDGALIASGVAGVGNGGEIIIQAAEKIRLSGPGSAPPFGMDGRGSSINTAIQPSGQGSAGNVLIETDQLELVNGSGIDSAVAGRGQGGNITINAADSIRLFGKRGQRTNGVVGPNSGSGITANVTTLVPNAEGSAGNIFLNTKRLDLQDEALVLVSGANRSPAGDLNINADLVRLTDQSQLLAETAAGDRGSIILSGGILLLRQGSQISTNSTDTATGGNINLTTDFVTAIPGENSDITANAVVGDGGQVNIRTNALLGIQFQEALTPFSDITASSDFGLDGTVTIDNPLQDRLAEETELPEDVEDPSNRIVVGCLLDENANFIVTGKGGVVASPREMANQALLWQDPRSHTAALRGQQRQTTAISSDLPGINTQLSSPKLAEAQGWRMTAQGTIELIAAQAKPVTLAKASCAPKAS